ncbi:DJ-1/PfpI family protein [Tissierella sp. MSJ-40]|uniref:DJ-1/PfpI family protein n=1 Tax=Tissierella simiarum TaxID=2841534 RepID=A0ABS6E894_9FIRM|nr:DJ-1/PfpI family protein [Tissierella simiarum]MBU5439128.1 DJ-1/PfpI family protein [Tissierella simiarum]
MKKTAILIYSQFCNFEFSVALEMLAMAGKSITIFAKSLSPLRSEEGLTVIPDKTISEINIEEYDSLLLTGSADIREAIEDETILAFIKKFDGENFIIGAISIAPLLLVKTGMLNGKKFMAGINKEEIYEEGFSEEDLKQMIGWDDNIENPVPEGYIREGNIITSISYNFIKWAIAFGNAVGIEVYPDSFGVSI